MALEGVADASAGAAAAQDDAPVPLGGVDAALLSLSLALFLALGVASGLAARRRRPQSAADSPGDKQEAPPASAGARAAAGLRAEPGRPAPPAAGTSASSAASSPLTPAERADDGTGLSIGVETRRRLFQLMLAAAALRACSLAVELATVAAVARLPASAPSRRLLAALLWLPSMLFLSLFGVVLLFLAQLCFACGGTASPWPRRLFLALNLLLYAGLAALVALARTAGDVWRGCDLAQSALYLAGLLGVAHYGMQLVRYFRLQSADDDFAAAFPASNSSGRGWGVSRRQAALRRITAVCILLCLLFATKAVYLVALGSGLLRSEQTQYRTPVGVSHVASEFVVHLATELVPCALLLFFMRRSGADAADRAPRSARTLSMSSVGANTLTRETAGEFLPVVGTRVSLGGGSGGSLRAFGGYSSGAGASAARQQPQQQEEAMAMLNPYHQQQQIRPGYGSVNTSGGVGRLSARGDAYQLQHQLQHQHQPYNAADGVFGARGAKMNGGAAAGRRDYASEYRRHNM